VRNAAFDFGILEQKSYDIPIIAVGNLSTGGTGKTPMIEYLVRQNKGKRIAILSRGYGRKTSGYREVHVTDDALNVGDEPLQFKNKYGSEVIIAVCEKRVDGIDKLLASHNLDLILLDDAYQHRYVKASTYILLTSYDLPYFDDYLLPAGNLRESRSGAARADIIVVTKCPLDISKREMSRISIALNLDKNQSLYFTGIGYADYMVNSSSKVSLSAINMAAATVVTGIAKPEPFVKYLREYATIKHLRFDDHHFFTSKELEMIGKEKLVITTEKDFMRLKDCGLKNVFYIPIETKFIGENKF
jgi:tetraacyldisaccharide 4'-kinase